MTRPTDQALVSDQARAGLDPTGIDPSRIGELEKVLRGLASYVGAGGYNAATVDPGVFERKIVWGINYLHNVTVQRCADAVEEQSKTYARNSYGDCKRAVLALKVPLDDGTNLEDWRVGRMHAELEHRVVSAKGGELFCELCAQLVGEDGTLHPSSCPLSHGYDHIRIAIATEAGTAETGTGSVHEGADPEGIARG